MVSHLQNKNKVYLGNNRELIFFSSYFKDSFFHHKSSFCYIIKKNPPIIQTSEKPIFIYTEENKYFFSFKKISTFVSLKKKDFFSNSDFFLQNFILENNEAKKDISIIDTSFFI